MALEIVDPNTTAPWHLASVDVKFSGVHIGGGIYFSANHNPSPGGSSTAIPQRSLIGEVEEHNTTEYDYTLPEGGEPWDAYRDDTNEDGELDFIKAGFDMSLHVGDRLTSTSEFYDGPAASLLIANDPNDLSGPVILTGYPSAANSLDGEDGTLHQTTGTLTSYTEQDVNGDIGGFFRIDDADVAGGMSGGGNFLDFDADGDGITENYLIATSAREVTVDLPGTQFDDQWIESTAFSPHYADLAAALQSLTGDAVRTADDFARMTLLSAQTPGSTLTLVEGQFFHEDIYGSVNSDTLSGGGGDDLLMGRDGEDTLNGGVGNDTLTGGAGADWFASGSFGDGFADSITDFEKDVDVIDLSGFFATIDDVIAATTEQEDGSILIALPEEKGGGSVLVFNTTIADLNEINVNVGVICFARGTLIMTPSGERPVEALATDDLVFTMDQGYQPIRWIGSVCLDQPVLTASAKLRPIRIRAGALGENQPEKDLIVSRQHRVLVRSKVALRMFDSAEVLIPANKLLDLDGVEIEEACNEVEYFHMLFDTHQIVLSNGAWTESLFTGPEALKAVSPAARTEFLTLFPDMTLPGYAATAARPIPRTARRMKKLVERHRKNSKPLVQDPA